VKRGRGRPPKDSSDIELMAAVQTAKAAGVSVPRMRGVSPLEQACDDLAGVWSKSEREQRGYSADRQACTLQLQRRYERVAREYSLWEPWQPRLRMLRQIFGHVPTWIRQRRSWRIELRRRPHQK
jgi:hypothetical protein